VREALLETSTYDHSNSERKWVQGKQSTPKAPVRPVCEGHAGTASQHVCKSREEEVNQVHEHCADIPDYKCTLRGTCAREEDVSVGSSNLTSAGCESKRERELRAYCQSSSRLNSYRGEYQWKSSGF
jgi:hypothetical protein